LINYYQICIYMQLEGRYNTQHNYTQHNDTQQKGLIWNTYHNKTVIMLSVIVRSVIMLSVAAQLEACV
jgi:hypothetical protein